MVSPLRRRAEGRGSLIAYAATTPTPKMTRIYNPANSSRAEQ